MSNLKEYAKLTQELLENDQKRDKMFTRIDKIYRIDWDMPPEMQALKWVKPVKSTDGHDALRGTVRILTARMPEVTVWPTSIKPEDQEKADKMERALRWFLHLAFQRNQTRALRDVVMSSARYDEICGQIIYLPYQKKLLEGFGEGASQTDAAARRLQAMERSGPFTIVIRNPRHVHTLYSEYGMEAVVYASVWPVDNILSFYGNAASEIRNKQSGSIDPPKFYLIYDIADYSNRIVQAIPVQSVSASLPLIKDGWPEETITIMDKPNELSFIPWVCHIGGTGLESDNENKHTPMLYSVDHADQYNIQNSLQTMLFSEAIQHAASPRWKTTGPGSDNIEPEYGNPVQNVALEVGQDIQPLEPPILDRGLMDLNTWVAGQVSKSTIPPILQGGGVGSVRNFAALNMLIKSGMVTIDPYKELAEQWIADALLQMLMWVKVTGEPVVAYERKKNEVTRRVTTESFTLDPSDINEKSLVITVDLQAEVPIDQTSKINGASMLQRMGLSKRAALEEVGETDAEGLLRESRYEAMEEFFLQRIFNKMNQKDQISFQTALDESKAGVQLKMMQAQQQMQAEQQQQQAQASQGQGGGDQFSTPYKMPGASGPVPTGPEPNPSTAPGAAGGLGGQGFNPAEGGGPAAEAQPGLGQNQDVLL